MKDISLHVLDLVQNSLDAGSDRVEILLDEQLESNCLLLVVDDNGRGMTKEQCLNALDPFYTTRTTRKIGLGLPLLKAAAERTGGELKIRSEPGVGTEVTAAFVHDHLDRPPLGDMSLTIMSLIVLNGHCHFIYTHRVNRQEFAVSSLELKEALAEVPLDAPQVAIWLRDYLREQEKTLEV